MQQSEKHVKKEMIKKLGQLQENLDEMKEMVELKSQEVPVCRRSKTSAYLPSSRSWLPINSMWPTTGR
jgi:hypothetical protein